MTQPARRPPRPALSVEPLEARDQPTAGPWLVEPFQRGPAAGLPTGWGQWSSDGSAAFRVNAVAPGLGDTGRLTAAGTTATAARAWVAAPFAADVEASAAVFLNSAVPAQLIARGRDLNTATPTYYAASVVRGGEVQLVRVARGQATVLGTVRSAEYVSNRWVQVRLRAEGDSLRVFVLRGDTNQYLGPDGRWSRSPVAAVERTDAAIRTGGQVGFARPARVAGDADFDSLRVGPANPPRPAAVVEERFDRGPAPGLPPGWSQWVGVPPQVAFRMEGDDTLRVDGPSSAAPARAWSREVTPADVQVSSSLYVDSLVPAGIFARGQNVYTNRPSYYALTVRRGMEVTLAKVVGGVETPLASIRSRDWLSGLWVQASLVAKGDQLRVQVYRSDTGQYLNPDGTWGLSPTWAVARTDTAIRLAGPAGLSRGAGYAGQVVFDNFIVTAAPAQVAVAGTIPTEQDKPPVELVVVPPEDAAPPPAPVPPTVPPPPPPVTPTTPLPTTPTGLPPVPRHYSHIRLANLAYYGTPLGTFEQGLLRNSIDLVIPNVAYQAQIAAVAPDTPQFVYTNVSNLYLGLYTDWLEYAGRSGLDREGAFFHATRATPFTGHSASAVPVNRLWGVYRGSDAGGWDNITSDARNTNRDFAFADPGEAVAFGFPEKFRELHFDLRSAAAGAWAGRFEYVRAVDTLGRPTSWGALTPTADGTLGLRRDGVATFDPPRDWVPASINGSARLYYARVRTATGGTTPVAVTVHGRDYTNSRGLPGGTIPAFDSAADLDRDGYLNDAEYARRRTGLDARFLYESRVFYPTYGAMRFATNPSNAGFRAWAADYHARVLAANPLADGFFVDNSNGRIALDPTGLRESLDTFAADYAAALAGINRRIGPAKWVIANTAGGGPGVEQLARNGVSYLEEFGLRPVSANHVQFDDLVANLANRRVLSGGRAYEILDSLLVGRDALDPRAQVATLAMYYAVADPDRSFLMMNGGNEPATAWTRHWTPAATYNVGRPTGAVRVFATGTDPANAALAYRVYTRDYQNAKVFYKPLSYTRGVNGTLADTTATTHLLDGYHRPLRADGTLGPAINRLTLRNGEGAILVRA